MALSFCPVYPRPRGGTICALSPTPRGLGLSPPTRGNQPSRRRGTLTPRSIPAHAGEPGSAGWGKSISKVYPRPRGGTLPIRVWLHPPKGLSPPTRGNRTLRALNPAWQGSIPAHAGEPDSGTGIARPNRVYPRPRGGTPEAGRGAGESGGLSPPTRGNPPKLGSSPNAHRSIPAHAGEPPPRPDSKCRPRVYPRPRGGTVAGMQGSGKTEGLSPPTRGNRGSVPLGAGGSGSIPAHAGEPGGETSPASGHRVYPRPRGGTSCQGDFGERPLSRREIPSAVFYQKHPVRVHDFARGFA